MKLESEKGASVPALIIFFIMGAIAFGVGLGITLSNPAAGIPFILFAALGGLFMVIAVIGVISVIKAKHDKNKLMSEGVFYKGTIIATMPHPIAHRNHVHPHAAVCQFTDNMTGGLRTVNSEYYYNNLIHYVGREVDIYIDRRNSDKYYVDMSKMVKSYKDPMSQYQIHDFRN